ncbi:hypothetical protein Cch01nite_01140 [Cellulomonas chitinilytica]|uniref:DUF3817 domain-containing protein n=1 Tax=Cellulomonas chitinilytica TaxID=398759 RepID=A0A919NYJ8_9CELL|nr:DUF3817 domain-containing protein [Cellulomonas chitinilytica]GIG19390.1 hypothetical protein Cch01nite_01140 [Cellulomonas chitinilytica]
MTETPTGGPTPVSTAPVDPWARRARGALARYRVMAWITGTMLLLLCVEIVLKYVLQVNGLDADGSPKPVIGTWVAFAHGWIYVVYLVTVVDLWSTMRWRLGRLAALAAAGVVPVMSFVLERRVHRQALAAVEDAAAR